MMPDTSPKNNTKPSSSEGAGNLGQRIAEVKKKLDPDGKKAKAFGAALIKDIKKICSDD
jgi:hypothetical protein